MIMKVLAYKDTKLNVFAQPFYMPDQPTADLIETMRRMCAGEVPARFFEYDVYLLGDYDDKLGKFVTKEPEFLVSLADYRHLAEKKEIEQNA